MSYKELYESLVTENQRLGHENAFLKAENDILKAEKKQWEQDKANQTATIQQTLTTVNLNNQALLDEICVLKAQLRSLSVHLN